MTNRVSPPNNHNSPPIGAEIYLIERDNNGIIHFRLRLRLEDGSEITITGFRYYPATDELKPPCYRVGKGWQPTVTLTGPFLDALREAVRMKAGVGCQKPSP